MTPKAIAEAIGVNVTTCYHLINTLEHEGLLQRDGVCRLGPRIGELHDAFEAMLAPDVRLIDLLDDLNRRLGETCYLGRWEGDDVVSVAVREGAGGVRVRGVHLGYRSHTYARALGRALLAFRGPEFIGRYLEETELVALTPRTVTSEARLRGLLAEVRRSGVAIEREELTEGVCCVGAPVFDHTGAAVAGLSVSVPAARFVNDEAAIVDTLREVASTATRRLRAEEVYRLEGDR
jgi:IclR family transcriptional regulator, acetate operon repressor